MSVDAPAELRSPLSARARSLAIEITGWPSVTGTPGEAAFAARLAGLLRDLPYFSAHPGDLILCPIAGDPLGRSNLVAAVRGRGRNAVMLSGHFDTVPVDDYGDLKDIAHSPEDLLPRLVERLEASRDHRQALADLKSGEFLPGRGLLDMKSGLAAGIAVLEAFAADPDREGNLVLLATPDEEDRSAGMRDAAAMLPAWLRERGLDVRLGINLDALCDEGDGAGGRAVAFGCIGKHLLSAFVVGKEAHAAYPLAGVNAAYLAAELVTELEFAPELGEDEGGELAAPPTVLGLRDLKPVYNVTLPGTVWTTWNVLVHRRPAAEVIDITKRLARRAMDRAAERMRERRARVAASVIVTPAWGDIAVLTFGDVWAAATARSPAFGARFADLAESLRHRADLDLPTRSRNLAEEAWSASGLAGPAVVLCFGSMPYPAVFWPEAPALETAIRAAVAEVETAHGVTIGSARFFPAIADMSFLGPIDPDDLAAVARQTPLWGTSIPWDLASGATPGFPLVNIGPWGRDYHHWLERVHAPYAFEVLPALVQAVARRVLRDL